MIKNMTFAGPNLPETPEARVHASKVPELQVIVNSTANHPGSFKILDYVRNKKH